MIAEKRKFFFFQGFEGSASTCWISTHVGSAHIHVQDLHTRVIVSLTAQNEPQIMSVHKPDVLFLCSWAL